MSAAAFLFLKLESLARRFPALEKLLKGSGTFIGLDVGSSSVKGVLLSRRPEGFALTKSSTVSLPSSADQEAKSRVMKEVLGVLDSGKVPVATAVSGAGSVLRSVLLPKMTPQELKTALSFEAEKHIPFKLEEAFLDSCIMGDRPGGRMEIFLAAARRELVNAHLELLGAAGVVPRIIDVEAAALANAWEVSHPTEIVSQSVALLHMGARGTILNFYSGSILQFTREIPYGGEFLKWGPEDRAGDAQSALQPRLEEWLAQCRSSFDFYENQFGHGVERLFLSGGAAGLTGLAPWLKEATGLPTDFWDPLAGLVVSSDHTPQEKPGLSLGVAVGLAVRGLSG